MFFHRALGIDECLAVLDEFDLSDLHRLVVRYESSTRQIFLLAVRRQRSDLAHMLTPTKLTSCFNRPSVSASNARISRVTSSKLRNGLC